MRRCACCLSKQMVLIAWMATYIPLSCQYTSVIWWGAFVVIHTTLLHTHDDVMTWKHFTYYRPFRRALVFPLLLARISREQKLELLVISTSCKWYEYSTTLQNILTVTCMSAVFVSFTARWLLLGQKPLYKIFIASSLSISVTYSIALIIIHPHIRISTSNPQTICAILLTF